MTTTQRLLRALLAVVAITCVSGQAAQKKIVLIAGKVSHGPGEHEFRAGCLLLKRCLDGMPGIRVEVHTNGWVQNDSAFNDAAAVVLYSDGGGGHPFIQGDRMKTINGLASQKVGIGCMHYAVEVPKGQAGQAMWDWIGGYYEDRYSCNPMWTPEFNSFPTHPITRGVKPFALRDEWYFNMRWRPDGNVLTPILVAKPSDAVRDGPYVWPPGPYPHIQANKGREETLMWAYERPDGGRGFGWTGGHYHKNWGNDGYRTVVLNAILWIANVEVPADGVRCTITNEDLQENLDDKGQKKAAVPPPPPKSEPFVSPTTRTK
jgi:hypothetical protein